MDLTDAQTADIAIKIFQVIALIGGGAMLLFKVGRRTERVELLLEAQGKAIASMQEDMRELNKVVTSVALQNQRLDMVASRLDILDRRYDELRHGEGYVFPLIGKTAG